MDHPTNLTPWNSRQFRLKSYQGYINPPTALFGLIFEGCMSGSSDPECAMFLNQLWFLRVGPMISLNEHSCYVHWTSHFFCGCWSVGWLPELVARTIHFKKTHKRSSSISSTTWHQKFGWMTSWEFSVDGKLTWANLTTRDCGIVFETLQIIW